METFFASIWPIAAVAGTFGVVLIFWMRSGGNNKLARMVYQKNADLFTEDDQRFYRTLQEAAGNDYVIFSKIQITDIIMPKRGAAGQNPFTSLATQCFDFVLLEPEGFAIACLIITQDSIDAVSLNSLQAICDAVALPLASFNAKKEYNAWQIRERLLPLLQDTPLTFTESYGRIEPHISNLEDIQL